MLNFFEAWGQMKFWRVEDAVTILTFYNALSEGHELPQDYLVSARMHHGRIKSFIELNPDSFPGKIEWVKITEENWREFDYNDAGEPTNRKINYYASTVEIADFLKWAVSKKINIPVEFKELLEGEREEAHKEIDKASTTLLKAAVHAVMICAKYGAAIKKEDLYSKVNKLSKISMNKFDTVWQLIPDEFKYHAGEKATAIEKAIKAAVYIGKCNSTLDKSNPYASVKQVLKGTEWESVENEHVTIILQALGEI